MADTTLDDDETVDALAHARALLGDSTDDEAPEPTTSVEEAVAAEAALPGMEEVPNVPSTLDPDGPPRRKTRRKAPNKKNPFSNMVGAGERLLVHKRDNLNGQLTYVGQYQPEDLMRSGNVDIFLQEYVVPTWKEGEFQLTLMGTDGSQKPLGSRKIGAPPGSQGSGTTAESSVQDFYELQQKMDAKSKEESDGNMKNMIAMMTMMQGFMPKKESSGGMGEMMPMMMMMMMMNQQQKPSGPDPMMQMLLTKLMDKDDDNVPPANFPMPPMMPAAASPTEDMASLATLITALKPAQTSTPVQDLAAIAQMFTKDDDKLTIKDLIAMAPMIKDVIGGNAPPNSFADTIQNLGQLQQVMQGMSGGGETSFADLIQSAIEAAPGVVESLKPKGAANTQVAADTQAPTTKAAARKVPPIPDGFKEFSDKINEAAAAGEEDDTIGDEEQLIEQTLRGLIWLRKQDKQWLPYVDGFLTFVKDDNKEKCMRLLEVFLRTFMDRDFITDGTANSTYQAFDENWVKVRIALGFDKAAEEAPSFNKEPDGGVEVTGSETVAEAGQDDTAEVIEDNDDEVEMSDEEIAALAAEAEEEEEEEEPVEEVVANGDGPEDNVIEIDASSVKETVVPPGDEPPQPTV